MSVVALTFSGLLGDAGAAESMTTVKRFQHVQLTPVDLGVGLDGTVYGSTNTGGFGIFRIPTSGTVEFLPSGSDFTTEYPFLTGPDGSLYTANFSTIYKVTPPATVAPLVEFNRVTQGSVRTAPQIDAAGNVYVLLVPDGNSDGVDQRIVKVSPSGVVTTLYNFSDDTDYKFANFLVLHPNGNLYGLAAETSTFDDVLYELPTSGGVPSVIAYTDIDDALVVGTDGAFYFVDEDNIRRVALNGAISTFATFNDGPEQILPIPGSADLFIRTFSNIRRVATNGTVSDFFNGSASGITALTIDGTGKLFFGTPRPFEQPASGTVETLTTNTPVTLAALPYISDGRDPLLPLASSADGNVYGIMEGGGSADLGVFFRVSPAGVYTQIREFTGLAGEPAIIFSALTRGPDGAFYFAGRDQTNTNRIFRIDTGGNISPAAINLTSGNGYRSLFLNGGVLHGATSSGVIARLPIGGTEVVLTTTFGPNALAEDFVAVSANGDMSLLWGNFGTGFNRVITRYSSTGSLVNTYNFTGNPSAARPNLQPGPGNALFGLSATYFPSGGARSQFFRVGADGTYTPIATFVGDPTAYNNGLVSSEGGLFYSGDEAGVFSLDTAGTMTRLAEWSPDGPEYVSSVQRVSPTTLLAIAGGSTLDQAVIQMFQNTFTGTPTDPTPGTDPGAGNTPPIIAIQGAKKIESLRKKVVIRGTVTSGSGVARIDVKARGAKAKKVKVSNGKFRVILDVTKESGAVAVKLVAVDAVGLKSKSARFKILRR